jgi:hypothetical protein
MAKKRPLVEKVKRALQPRTRVTFTAATELFATFDQTCWLCGTFVPKRTRHRCGVVREE